MKPMLSYLSQGTPSQFKALLPLTLLVLFTFGAFHLPDVQAQCPTPVLSPSGTVQLPQSGTQLITANTGSTYEGGSLLTYNGSTYWDVPHNSAYLAMANNLTIEAWVYLYDNVNNAIIDKGDYSFLFMTHPNGQPGLGFYNPNGGWTYSSASLPTSQWVHVAVTWNSSTGSMKFYHNGSLVSSHFRSGVLSSDAGNVNIGRQQPFACQCNLMNGQIDELRMWSVERSASDLSTYYNRTAPVNATGLVGYFKFNEGSGTTTSDVSPVGAVGSLGGSANWSNSTANIYTAAISRTWSTGSNAQNLSVNSAGSYSLTATYSNGCVSTSAATTVVANDNTPPVITCQPVTVSLDGSGNGSIDSADVVASLFDSSPVTVSLSNTSFDCNDLGSGADQSQTSGFLTIGGFDGFAQTFKAGQTGNLYALDLFNMYHSSGNVTVTVEIRSGSNPIGGTVLATEQLAVTGSNADYTVNFSSPAAVVAGQSYLYTVKDGFNPGLPIAGSGTQNPYPDGNAVQHIPNSWNPNTSIDFAFNTYVSAGNTVTVTATDASGNTATCDAAVTVEDNLPPSVTTQPATVVLDANGNASLTASQVIVSATDNCGTPTTSINTTSFDCSNARGASLNFDGSSDFLQVNGSLGTGSISHTFEEWVKVPEAGTNGLGTTERVGILIGNYNSNPNSNYEIHGQGQLRIYWNGGQINQYGTTDLRDGKWHHIAFVRDVSANQFRAYIDGNLEMTVNTAGSNINFTSTFRIAGDNRDATGGPSFHGNMDDIRVWNYARTQAEIQADLGRELTGGETGLMHYWPIEEGSGTVVNDLAGSLNATLTNMSPTSDWEDGGYLSNLEEVTVTATDGAGNTGTFNAYVTIEDNTAPTLSVTSYTLIADGSGNAILDPATVQANVVENCSLDCFELSNTNFNCGSGTQPVTVTMVDVSGNKTVQTIQVTIQDVTPPSVTCQPVTLSLDANGSATLTSSQVVVSSSDNCGPVTFSLSNTSFDCTSLGSGADQSQTTGFLTIGGFDGFAQTFKAGQTGDLYALDLFNMYHSSGNVTVTVEIRSGTNPIGGTVLATEQLAVTGSNADYTVNFSSPAAVVAGQSYLYTVKDGFDPGLPIAGSGTQNPYADGDAIQHIPNSWNPNTSIDFAFNTYVSAGNNVTVTATDASGNTATCEAAVTIEDNILPVLTCPSNILMGVDAGQCSAVVNYTTPTATDNCTVTVTQTAGLPSGSTFPIGTTTNTFEATDAGGNTVTCSFTVIVEDDEDPVLTCPANLLVGVDPGQCGAVVNYTTPVGTDNCPGVTTIQVAGLASGSFFPIGTTTQTFEVTDDEGNMAICSFTVTVEDDEDPVMTCPTNIVVNNDPGQCGAVVNFTAPTGTDNCPGATTIKTSGLASGSFFPIGTTTQSYEVTDDEGNVAICSFTVTVNDNEAPALTCPATISVNTDPGICGAVVNYTAPQGTDNCSGVVTVKTGGLASGSLFPIGTSTISFMSTDAAGLTTSCSFDVVVTDNEAPNVITQPVTVYLDGNGVGSLTVGQVDNGTSDNCGIATLVLDDTSFDCSDLPSAEDCQGTALAFDGSGQRVTGATGAPYNLTPTSGFTLEAWVKTTGNFMSLLNKYGSNGYDVSLVNNGRVVIHTSKGPATNYMFRVETTTAGFADGNWHHLAVTYNGSNSSSGFTIYRDGVAQPYITYNNSPGGSWINSNPFTIGARNNGALPFNGQMDEVRVWNVHRSASEVNSTMTTCLTGNEPGLIGYYRFNDGTGSSTVTDHSPSGLNASLTSMDPNSDWVTSGANLPATAPGGSGPVVTLTATDVNGVSASATAAVTVLDTIDPVITCGSNMIVGVAQGQCDAVVTYTTPTATDNCTVTISQTVGLPSGSSFPVGTTTNTYEAVDASGNTVTCSFTIIVEDDEDPVISCPANISVNNDPGVCGATINYATPVGTDNCPGATTIQVSGLPSGSVFPLGTTTNTFEVTDDEGNMAICSFTVTVNDNEAPVLACPATISVNTDPGVCGAVVNYTAPQGTDNCSGVVTVKTGGLASGSLFPVGTSTISFMATDAAGLTTSCSFDVVVTDNEVPNVITQPVTVYLDGNGVGSLTAGQVDNGTSDNCGIATLVLDDTSFDCSDLASAEDCQGTALAFDGSGQRVTGATGAPYNLTPTSGFTLEAWVKTTGNFMSLMNKYGSNGYDVSLVNNGRVVIHTSKGPATNYMFRVETTTAGFADGNWHHLAVTYNGSNSSSGFTIYRDGVAQPYITYNNSPGGSWINSNPFTIGARNNGALPFNGQMDEVRVWNVHRSASEVNSTMTTCLTGNEPGLIGYYRFNDGAGSSTVTDHSPSGLNASLTSMDPNSDWVTSGANLPATAPGGSGPVVTLTATDVNGVSASATAAVTVLDTLAPSITCPANLSVGVDPGQCNAVVNFVAPIATDNCSATVTQTAGLPSGSTFPVGTTVNTYEASDASGNTATCSFSVTVLDTIAPSVTCLNDTVILDSLGQASVTIGQLTGSASDNCGVVDTTASQTNFTVANVGNNAITVTVTDPSGNTATCIANVFVIEPAPEAICQNITVYLDGSGQASITANDVDGGSNSLVGISNRIVSQSSFDCSNLGANNVTLTVFNTFNASDSCVAVVTVVDTIAPAISCPANVSVNTDAGVCGAAVTYATPVGTDNCPTTTVQTAGLASGSVFPVGTTTNTFVVTDASGNSATCSFDVVVTDNEAPALACPTNISVNTDAGVCGAAVTYATPVGTDNCSGTVTVQTAGLASGSVFPVGTTTNTFEAIDANGNITVCSFDVTAADNEAPAITCPANIAVNTDLGACGATVTYSAPVGTDNCASTTVQTAGLPSGSVFPVGVTTNTFEVTDASGNVTTCSFDVTVTDNEAPAITCPANIAVNTDLGVCGAYVEYGAPVGTDNCSGPTTIQTAGLPSGSTFPVGTTTNTFEVTDASGNTTTCSFTVTVTDNEAPAALCQNLTIRLDVNGNASITAYDVDNGSNDACGVSNLAIDVNTFDCTNLGANTVTLTVTDVNGNTSTCTSTVTVEETYYVDITCPDDIQVACNFSQGGKHVSWDLPTALTYSSCDPGCPTSTHIAGFIYLGEYNGHRYYCSQSSKKTWFQANALAQNAGGHLAVINSAGENQFLASQLLNTYAWIGLTDQNVEGTFEWVNGDPVNYTKWKNNEPNNLGGNCCNNWAGADFAVIRKNNGKWFDRGGCNKYEFIMEVPCGNPVSYTQIAGPSNGSLFTTGTTTITYVATDDVTGATDTCSFDVTVDECVPNYCNSSGYSTYYEWIQKVKAVNNFTNNSGNDGGYADYTSYTVHANTGDQVTLKLTPGFNNCYYKEHWRVWVDWNRDGDFYDWGEKVYQGKGYGMKTATFNVPVWADSGDLRMRVSMKWGGYPGPCSNFWYGEVEDYSFVVDDANPGMAKMEIPEVVDADENAETEGSGYEFVKLYPNPYRGDGELRVELRASKAETAQVRVMNAMGQLVFEQQTNLQEGLNRISLQPGKLASGVYLISIPGHGESLKLTVQ